MLTCSLLARRLTGYLPSFRSLFLPHLVTYVLTDLLTGFCKKPSLLWTNSRELIEACRGGFHRRAPPRSRPAHSSPTQGELRPSSGRAQAELRSSSGRAQAELPCAALCKSANRRHAACAARRCERRSELLPRASPCQFYRRHLQQGGGVRTGKWQVVSTKYVTVHVALVPELGGPMPARDTFLLTHLYSH